MQLSDSCTDYLNHIRTNAASPVTCLHYQSWLRHFAEWLNASGYPDPAIEDVFNLATLRRYQYHKAKEGVKARTVHSAFYSLKGLGEFLVANGFLTENPCKQLTLPKKGAALRLEVTDEDVSALFAACERQPTERQVALYRAVVSVLCYGGLRRTECCDLRVSDINLSSKSILVRSGKGDKSRKVFICKEGIDALRDWLTFRRREWEEVCDKQKKPKEEADFQAGWLFLYDRRRRIYHEGIHTLIEALKATAGLRGNEAVKPHGLRHWCATNMLRNGVNLKDVQQFLGHTDLATTAKYLHSSEQQLRSVAELTALRPQTPPQPHRETTEPRTGQREPRGERLRRVAR